MELNNELKEFIAYYVGRVLHFYHLFDKEISPEDAFEQFTALVLTGKPIKTYDGQTVVLTTLTTNYLDMDKVSDGKYNNDQLMAITKAGTYYRYALANGSNFSSYNAISDILDMRNALFDLIDKKYLEDHPSEDAMAEVEKLIEETDEILDEAEESIEEDSSEEIEE